MKRIKIGKNKIGKAVGVDDVIIESNFGFTILGVSDLQFRTLDKQPLQSINQLIYIHLYSSAILTAKKEKKTITIRTRKTSNHLQAKRSETIVNKTAP